MKSVSLCAQGDSHACPQAAAGWGSTLRVSAVSPDWLTKTHMSSLKMGAWRSSRSEASSSDTCAGGATHHCLLRHTSGSCLVMRATAIDLAYWHALESCREGKKSRDSAARAEVALEVQDTSTYTPLDRQTLPTVVSGVRSGKVSGHVGSSASSSLKSAEPFCKSPSQADKESNCSVRSQRQEELEADRQLGQLLHGLAAGEAGVVGGAAGDKHDAPAALDGPVVVHQAAQRDALLVVGVPGRVHPLLHITQTSCAGTYMI